MDLSVVLVQRVDITDGTSIVKKTVVKKIPLQEDFWSVLVPTIGFKICTCSD